MLGSQRSYCHDKTNLRVADNSEGVGRKGQMSSTTDRYRAENPGWAQRSADQEVLNVKRDVVTVLLIFVDIYHFNHTVSSARVETHTPVQICDQCTGTLFVRDKGLAHSRSKKITTHRDVMS